MYMCIYVYLHMYIYVYKYIYIHMCINVYAHVCVYISVCVAAVLSIYIHEKRPPKMAYALFNVKLHGAATRYAYANHANKRQVTHVNEACQKCESGVPRMRMSNVKRENEAELPARCAHAIARK